MKEKPLAIVITLVGGLVACICCIIRKAGLLKTLIAVLVSLIVFMIIGLIIHKIYTSIKQEVDEAEQKRIEEEEAAREAEEARIAEEKRLAEEEEARLEAERNAAEEAAQDKENADAVIRAANAMRMARAAQNEADEEDPFDDLGEE